jgi:hypothetical protein
MYSKSLEPKINKMFSEIGGKVSEIISNAPSMSEASESIANLVASETATRSKTMLSDMFAALSTQVMDSIADVAGKNRFYEANLRQELFDKYVFDVPHGGINFTEANRVYTSLAAGAGTGLAGSVLVFALSRAAPVVPIALVVAASVAVFCTWYFKVTPDGNKEKFAAAVDKYLSEVKSGYISWFDEVERYFNRRAEEIKCSI